MPGYHMDKDEGFQAGRNELEQHVRNADKDQPPSGGGCSKAAVLLTGLSAVAAAYVGHKYGVA